MSALSAIAAFASIASGVIGAVGAIAQGQAQKRAADYNAAIDERNAVIAGQNRKLTIETADIAARDKERENRRIIHSISAAYGSSGLELAGSPLDVLQDTAMEQAVDVQRIRYEGYVRAREGAIQILGLHEDATLKKMEGKAAQTAGYIGAAGSIFGGVGGALQRLA